MKALLSLFAVLAAIVLCVVIGTQTSHRVDPLTGAAAALIVATLAGAALSPRSDRRFAWAVGPWTLLDLAARSGKGVHSLIEGVLTYAPEMSIIPFFPRAGLSYDTLTRTELPSGDFLKVGAGSPLGKSKWERATGSMCLFGAQFRIAEDIVMAARAQQPDLAVADILADEAIATLRGSAIRIGSQVWYGDKISADGFAGLSTQVNTAKYEVNAGGATNADSSSAYLVVLADSQVNPQGVHGLVGNGGTMTLSDTWQKQQVEITPAANGNPATYAQAYTNGFLSFLGLVALREEVVFRVKNINPANPLTDAVAAELVAKIPLGLRQRATNLRWFFNTQVSLGLQKSRSTVSTAKTDSAILQFAPEPTSLANIPIVLTDSLVATERNGLKP